MYSCLILMGTWTFTHSFMTIHAIVVKTFYSKPQISTSTSWWRETNQTMNTLTKLCVKYRCGDILRHTLVMSVFPKFHSNPLVIVEIFQSGRMWWTNWLGDHPRWRWHSSTSWWQKCSTIKNLTTKDCLSQSIDNLWEWMGWTPHNDKTKHYHQTGPTMILIYMLENLIKCIRSYAGKSTEITKQTLSLTLSTMNQSNQSKNRWNAGNWCQSEATICIINTLNQRWRAHY